MNNFWNQNNRYDMQTIGTSGSEYDLSSQVAMVHIDMVEFMKAYVESCKQMFELGQLAATLGNLSPDQAQKMMPDQATYKKIPRDGE